MNDAYFGKVPPERLKVYDKEGFLLFKCDGDHRGKIGIPPGRAREYAGSYSASSKLLTLVQYDKPKGATDYVNSMWEQQKQPFAGDVVNSYNDGAPAPGKDKLGGFYEIETSSPAAALAPRASLVHTHRTFHFAGEISASIPSRRRRWRQRDAHRRGHQVTSESCRSRSRHQGGRHEALREEPEGYPAGGAHAWGFPIRAKAATWG